MESRFGDTQSMNHFKILGISGSLRERSSNANVLRAIKAVAPADVEVAIHAPLDTLPFFNPDVEERGLPPTVAAWRASIAGADALVISSPEYAHGVSGVLKNALDWLVGGVEISGKPIAVINARPEATIAHGALVETLRIMGGRIVDQTALPLTGRGLDAQGIATDVELGALLHSVLFRLREAVETPSSQ
jgi:NAD(P)H-dependent FMN reductase